MTPDDILRIARAMGLQVNDDGCVYVSRPDEEWDEYVWQWVSFDPLNSNDDAFRVLAFLLRQKVIHGACTTDIDFYHANEWQHIPHDGTEAGLRRAITEAAGRVVP